MSIKHCCIFVGSFRLPFTLIVKSAIHIRKFVFNQNNIPHMYAYVNIAVDTYIRCTEYFYNSIWTKNWVRSSLLHLFNVIIRTEHQLMHSALILSWKFVQLFFFRYDLFSSVPIRKDAAKQTPNDQNWTLAHTTIVLSIAHRLKVQVSSNFLGIFWRF